MNVLDKLKSGEAHIALQILFVLNIRGFDAFLVGGCVRDIILEKEPKDFDIATNAPMEVISELYKCYDIGSSKDFGIVAVNVSGFTFEIANFRVDGAYSDSRHPDSVEIVKDFYKDVLRRDFTINALGIDGKGNVIDHVGGLDDIKQGLIKTVGNPFDRFNEDPLRVVRAVRFAGMLGFDIEDDTKNAMKHYKANVNVSPERIHAELFKMSSGTGEQLANCVLIMNEVGLLEDKLPEVFELKKVNENERWHPEAYENGDGTVFSHVICALKAQKESGNPLLNLAVLFHDLGKAVCWTFDEEKGNRFSGHAHESVELIEHICKRLKFSNDELESVSFCAREHMNFHTVHKMKRSSIARHFDNKNFELLVKVVHADDSCRLHKFNEEEFFENLETVRKTLDDFKNSVSKGSNKLVDGNIVIELTGEKPGKVIGDIISMVSDEILNSEEFVCTVRRIKDAHKQLK